MHLFVLTGSIVLAITLTGKVEAIEIIEDAIQGASSINRGYVASTGA